MSHVKVAAAYIRVSDERQDEYSPDSQLKKIREYAKSNSYIIPEEYIFYDDGISGRSASKRDQFRTLIGLAKEKDHPVDAILVWKFSRFARNQEESIVYKSALQKIGVDVISISEPLPEGPFGSLIERFIEWMDEYYSINLAGEVRRGMHEKVLRGEPICAPAIGYYIRDKKYYPNADAEIVREVFDKYLAGVGMRRIAVDLAERGVRTKFGNPPDNRWIEYILNNPVYIGKIRWSTEGRAASKRDYNSPNMIITDGVHEPIITQYVWDRTQKLLADNAAKHTKYARREALPPVYTLRSLFRCSSCGATMVRVNTKSPTLQCHNYARGKCRVSHSITIKRAEAALIAALEYTADNNTFAFAPSADTPQAGSETDTIHKQIAAEKRRLQRAKEAYQAGIDTLEEYADNKKKIAQTISDLEAKLSAVSVAPHPPEHYAALVKDALILLHDPSSDPSLANHVLTDLLDRVIFHADTRTIDVFFRP